MYKLKIENVNGDRLELTNNPNYDVKVTGLNPVTSDITTAKVANRNGARYVNSRKQTRNVVITVYIKEPVEANRIELYKYVKSKEWLRVYYSNKSRDVYVDGYVESFECDLFTQTQTAQISVICPNPQLIDVEPDVKDVSTVIGAFSFPFSTARTDNVIEFTTWATAGGTATTVKINENGSVYMSGVFSASAGTYDTINISTQTLGAGDYTLKGIPASDTNLILVVNVNGTEYIDSGEGVTFTLTETSDASIYIKSLDDRRYSKLTIYPVLKYTSKLVDNVSEYITFSIYDKLARLIINGSDDDIGFIYKIHCKGLVVNPTIYMENTKQSFKLKGSYRKDTTITITTLDGQKSVTSEYKGVVTNIINSLDATSKWIKLKAGYNHILQIADTGVENMVSELIYSKEYEGV